MESWDSENAPNPFLYPALITFLSSVWTQISDMYTHGEQGLVPRTQSSSALVFLLLEKKERENKEIKIKKGGRERRKMEGEVSKEGKQKGKEGGMKIGKIKKGDKNEE